MATIPKPSAENTFAPSKRLDTTGLTQKQAIKKATTGRGAFSEIATTPPQAPTPPPTPPPSPFQAQQTSLTERLGGIQQNIAERQTEAQQQSIGITRGDLMASQAQKAEAGLGRGRPLGLVRGRQQKIGEQREFTRGFDLLEQQTRQAELSGLRQQEANVLGQRTQAQLQEEREFQRTRQTASDVRAVASDLRAQTASERAERTLQFNLKSPERQIALEERQAKRTQVAFEQNLSVQGFSLVDPADAANLEAGSFVTVPNPVTGQNDVYKKPPLKDLTINEQINLRDKGLVLDENGKVATDVSGATTEQIARTIRQIESGENYEARGASGEFGAYQFMPATWEQWSSEYLQSIGEAPQSLDQSQENQDAVAEFKINQLQNQGFNPLEIASIWNSGKSDWVGNVGTNSQGVKFNVPAYVSRFRNTLSQSVDTKLSPEQELIAGNLAVKIFGKKAGADEKNIKKITDLMGGGKTADDIEDLLRFAGQSELLTGNFRDAIESVTTELGTEKRNNVIESFERRLDEGNEESAKEFLMKSAIDSFGTEESKSVRGTKRTIEFLDEIENDLKILESNGIDTGIFAGTTEKMLSKVGEVGEPELRKVATKIAAGIQKYRRAMSGVAFSEPESREYKQMFPSIDKVDEFNTSVIKGLRETMQGDFDFFMSNAMGSAPYQAIFQSKGDTTTGRIQVILRETGQTGTILAQEFDDEVYERIE